MCGRCSRTGSGSPGRRRAPRSTSNNVIADKKELVGRVSDFLSKPTAEQLQAAEQAYMDWHGSRVAVAYQLLTAGEHVLLPAPHALPEGGRHRGVDDLDAAAGDSALQDL